VTITQTVPAGVTGTITFYNNGTAIGTATISNGVATLTTSSLPAGTNSITTGYGGNGNYTSANSASSVTVTIAPPGYTITANPNTMTIHAGSTGNTVLTFTPFGGFAGTFMVACNGLPANAVCNFTQNGQANNTVVMTGNNQPIPVNLAIVTDMPHAALEPISPFGPKATGLALILPCGVLGLLAFGKRRKALPKMLSLTVLMFLGLLGSIGLSGCAGGFGTTSTPLGNANVVVTATATATTSANTSQNFSMTITIIQ
jgi:hypothetical protein